MDKPLEYISEEPFDDYALKNFIRKNGIEEYCDWTEKMAICISIEDLAEYIEKSLLTEFDEPYALGAGYDKEEEYYEDRFPGLLVQSSEELLQDLMIDTPFEVRDYIAKFLSNEYWTSKNLYSPSTGEILFKSWEQFTDLIKYKVRFMFFSKNLKREKPTYEDYTNPYNILDEIGEGIKKHELVSSYKPYSLKIFRARQHSIDKVIKSVSELGSPPENRAQANRLSPAGIPMFYGAFDINTALIEVTDFGKVNEAASVGTFTNLQKLNLIDFSELKWISIFDLEKRHLRESYVLLGKFLSDLSSPISNDGTQHIDYVPTQVVTEYLKNTFTTDKEQEVHGLIYPSSKNKNKNCVVLFFTQEHLTQNKKDTKKFMCLDISTIKSWEVKDITVSINLGPELT